MTNDFCHGFFWVRQELSKLGLFNFREYGRSITQQNRHKNAHLLGETRFVMNLEISTLPNLSGEMGGGRGFRSWAGWGVAGWPKPETQLGCGCLAFCRCFPFLSDRYLFPVWFCMDITGHIMNWRVEWGQAKVEIQTQLIFPCSSFLFLQISLSPADSSLLLKGPHTLSYFCPPLHQFLFQQKIWHLFICQSEFKPARYLPLIFVAIELTFVCFWLCSYVYCSMKTASGAPL